MLLKLFFFGTLKSRQEQSLIVKVMSNFERWYFKVPSEHKGFKMLIVYDIIDQN